ncbi:hypothetical protein [Glycomyces arizonensis]|uniref:hypothetical protein n=1 Tax=Glycomyces arizonensis TaxID=256035 RepID=UPI0012EB3B12|nr:hypothetical protein [Glycomyces arizonensis]
MSGDALAPGDIRTRQQLKRLFGGGVMSGIEPSATTPNVLLYSDPSKGEQYGYYDYLNEEDEYGPFALYTGEGKVGPHKMTKGNKAILHHLDDERALRLFIAVGKVEGSGTKLHQYLGEYQIDAFQPYELRKTRDQNGDERDAFVFRLRPVGLFAPPPIDYMPTTIETTLTEMHSAPPLEPVAETSSRLLDPERHSGVPVSRKASAAISVRRREAELVQRFRAFLERHRHEVKRYGISIAGLRSLFPTDVFDRTDGVLYEAKGTASRNAIRLAIGQLFDYRRHIRPEPARLAILLPEAPEKDLQELIESVGISLVYEDGDEFIGWPVA